MSIFKSSFHNIDAFTYVPVKTVLILTILEKIDSSEKTNLK